MAIYKPSNCVPFLDTWDLTQGQSVSFEINTNNNEVNAYKIRILDSKNNVIFEGRYFSPIKSGAPVAYNGEIVEVPLIVRVENDREVRDPNIIYYNVRESKYKCASGGIVEVENFSNGYINQPYKWQVILGQGMRGTTGPIVQRPTDNKYYDMNITNGTVIGSTPNRIQAPLSEYIYKDYFIQLLKANEGVGYSNVGKRVLIKSYDHTYGHITPQEGVFTEEDIKNAEYFSIFKNTNDAQYINTNRIVSNVTSDGLQMGSVKYGDILPSEWKPSADTSKYYFVQTYTDVQRPSEGTETELDVSIPLSNYCSGVSGNFNPSETTLLVRGEGSETDGVYLSAYNGVFLFVSAKWKANAEGDTTKGTLTITWQRPAMADTWGDLLGQSFFVQQTGENWDSTATAGGEINATQIGFYKEKAVEIYPQEATTERKTIGKIYKTTATHIYIRPFVGIEDGMRFSYIQGNNSGYIDDITIDTDSWCVIAPKNEVLLTPDVDTYSILSFFKISDENPFYGYEKPTIKITKINDETDMSSEDDLIINDRVINVVGTYEQSNNKMWKSFQWSLYDLNYNTTQYDDVKYSGEIAAQFVGLEKDHNYELTLSIEDELGRTFSTSKNFVISNVIIVDPFKDVQEHFFDCSTHSIDVSVAGTYGIIDEGITGDLVLCSNDTICATTLLCGGSIDGIYYKNVSIGSGTSKIEGTLIEPTTGDLTLNFETKILDDNLIGDLIGVEIGNVEDNADLRRDTDNDLIAVFLPDVLMYTDTGVSRVNDDRYKIYTFVKIAKAKNKEQIYEVKLYDVDGNELENNSWATARKVCFGYQPQSTSEDGYDYIIADEWLDNNGNYLKTLNGWKYNFASNYQGIPAAIGTDNTDGIWSDKKLMSFEQPNGQVMQLITNENNVWHDTDDSGNPYKWSDKGYQAYEQVEVQNKTGRELLNGKTLNFNLAYKNYVYKPNVATSMYVQCVVSMPQQETKKSGE